MAVEQHEKPAVAARDEHVDAPSWVMSAVRGATNREVAAGTFDCAQRECTSWCAFHAEGQAQRAVATEREQLSAASSLKRPTAAATTSSPKRMLGLGPADPFSQGRCCADEMVPQEADRDRSAAVSSRRRRADRGGYGPSRATSSAGRSDGNVCRRLRGALLKASKLERSTKHPLSVPFGPSPIG